MTVPMLERGTPPAPGPLRPFHFPPVHRHVLGNGLRVLVAESHDLPVVSFGVLLGIGGMHEPDALGGVAALTGDLLESGTATLTAAEIAERLEGAGIFQETSVSWDSIHSGFTALEGELDRAAELLADLALRPSFPAGEVERLRDERLAAISQRRSSPGGIAGEVVMRTLFAPESPVSRPLGGDPVTVRALTRQDVVNFHARAFQPTATWVVAAGDITPERAVGLAERHFGDWVGGGAELGAAPVLPHPAGRRVIVVDRPGAVQSEIRAGHLGIARDDPDFVAVSVMNHIFGGGFSSRLNLNLRERNGYTYGVSSSFLARRQPGPFLISTAVQTEVTGAAVREILAELEGMREAPPRPAELKDAREYMAGVLPLRMETTSGVASRLMQLAIHHLPDDYFERYRAEIMETDADAVLRAARERLRPEALSIVVVGDAARIRSELEALGIGPIERIDAPTED